MDAKNVATFKVKSPKHRYKDDMAYENLVHYIADPKKARRHDVYARGVTSLENAAFEMSQLAAVFESGGTHLRHMILSFHPKAGIGLERISELAWTISGFYSADYQIVSAVHSNKKPYHIHFVMNTLNYRTGKKYSGSKKEYYDFINFIKHLIKEEGIALQVISDKELELY